MQIRSETSWSKQGAGRHGPKRGLAGYHLKTYTLSLIISYGKKKRFSESTEACGPEVRNLAHGA